jgi:hypothetical protein
MNLIYILSGLVRSLETTIILAVFLQDWTEVVTSRKFVVFREGKLETLLVSCIIFEVEKEVSCKTLCRWFNV